MAKTDWGKIDKLLNTALSLQRAGQNSEAARLYHKILRIVPRHVESLHLLAVIVFQEGRLDAAAELAARALEFRPEFPEALVNLGIVRRAQGRQAEALACFEQALRLRPAYPDALNSLGLTLHVLGRVGEAVERYRQALALRPDYPDALNNLGNAEAALGDLDAAAACFRQALRARPGFTDALINLGNALKESGRAGEAAARYREALAIEPDSAMALGNLANLFKDQGRIEEAVALYRRALELRPEGRDVLSNLLYALNNADTLSARALFDQHARLGAELDARAGGGPAAEPVDRDPERRLRIGYVSPDFRDHSVSWFLLPLLAAHDRAAVEIFCYAEVMVPDVMTARLRGLADHWLSSVGLSDDALAARIRADGVDILVDLAGHTAHNRLAVFARRPAPVQISWLGYPNTTGLKSIGYRLVDAVSDPEGEADVLATETLVRLEGGFLCYGPPEDAPEPPPPPCLASGIVTFGSFNNPAKLSESTVECWSALLLRLPAARLLLKGQAFADSDTAELVRRRFARHGVAAGRIELVARIADAAGHLGAYGRIDIGLDPFPYNGTTTTCEALWMGVPVVTLLGDRHAARVGASLLGGLGLGELIARDRAEYLEIAAALAGAPGRLAELRAGLRPRLAASRLCDAPAFARTFEAACRRLWRRALG